MTTTTGNIAASSIVDAANICIAYAERLLDGVTPDVFARFAKDYTINHPAWVFGHLAIYPDKALLPLLGRDDLVTAPPADFESLFNYKSECRDDPDGSIYPAMDVIRGRFFDRTKVALAALKKTSDETLARPTPPDHPFHGRINNVGGVVNFMLSSHTMMHLGQISAWRRVMGLGPCL